MAQGRYRVLFVRGNHRTVIFLRDRHGILLMEREGVPGGQSRATAERVRSTPVEQSRNVRYGEHHAD